MEYQGKLCKKFLERFIKLLNSISRYNIEPIVLMQIASYEDTFEPVIMNKPYKGNIFDYLKILYANNEDARNNLDYMNTTLIKLKKDQVLYEPVLFSHLNPLLFLNISSIPLNEGNFLIPEKKLLINFSKSYFLVIDLFKDFIKNHEIDCIDDTFRLYDKDHLVYDTSAFLYENDLPDQFDNTFIQNTSPVRFFPINYDEEFTKETFINNINKELLINLNQAVLNIDYKSFLIIKNVDLFTDKSQIENILDELSTHGVWPIETSNGKVLLFHDFMKQKYEYFGVTSIDSTEHVPLFNHTIEYRNIGLVLKTKEFITYVFYKYYKRGDII